MQESVRIKIESVCEISHTLAVRSAAKKIVRDIRRLRCGRDSTVRNGTPSTASTWYAIRSNPFSAAFQACKGRYERQADFNLRAVRPRAEAGLLFLLSQR